MCLKLRPMAKLKVGYPAYAYLRERPLLVYGRILVNSQGGYGFKDSSGSFRSIDDYRGWLSVEDMAAAIEAEGL